MNSQGSLIQVNANFTVSGVPAFQKYSFDPIGRRSRISTPEGSDKVYLAKRHGQPREEVWRRRRRILHQINNDRSRSHPGAEIACLPVSELRSWDPMYSNVRVVLRVVKRSIT